MESRHGGVGHGPRAPLRADAAAFAYRLIACDAVEENVRFAKDEAWFDRCDIDEYNSVM